mgnify:CR=1 FL=1
MKETNKIKVFSHVLVRVENAYKDRIKLKNGVEIFLSSVIREVKDTIRYGKVIAVPDSLKDDLKVGDTLFFHHNIVGVTVMESGVHEIQSQFLIDKENGVYRVPVDSMYPLIYAKISDGEFSVWPGTCFVRPIFTKKYDTFLEIVDNKRERQHIGEVVYCDKEMESNGISPGDKVIFSNDSEYEFEINGEVLYCMLNRWILGKLDE